MREAAGGKAYQLCRAACMGGSRRQGAGKPSRLPARSLCTRPDSARHRPWPSLCTLTVSSEERAGTMAAERASPSASLPRSQGPTPTRHPSPAPRSPPRNRREGGQRNAMPGRKVSPISWLADAHLPAWTAAPARVRLVPTDICTPSPRKSVKFCGLSARGRPAPDAGDLALLIPRLSSSRPRAPSRSVCCRAAPCRCPPGAVPRTCRAGCRRW